MKKKRILGIVLASTFLFGVLAACTPSAPDAPTTVQQQAAPPTGQQVTPQQTDTAEIG